MAIALCLLSAMVLGVGFVLQQHAAEQAPKAYFLRLRLITDLMRRPRWLLGMAVMGIGELLSAWAVGHMVLSLYEPLQAMSLIFALALAVPLSGQPLRATEVIGALMLSGGVAALSLAHTVGSDSTSFGSPGAWPAAIAIAAVACVFVHAGRRRSGQLRATLTGAGTGLVFGISDALTRRVMEIMDAHSFVTLFTSWPVYCLVASSVIGLWLMENSFSAAPLHASLPAITAAEPVAGILLGVLVFGDVISVSPGMLVLQAVGLVALVTGVIMVARAPCLSSLRHMPARPARPDHPAPPGRYGPRSPELSRVPAAASEGGSRLTDG